MKAKTAPSLLLPLVALALWCGPASSRALAAESPSADKVELAPAPSRWQKLSNLVVAVGVHDMAVPDVDSHTYGIDAEFIYNGTFRGGINYVLEGDVFLDFDQDHLDPDHIPVWWQLHLGVGGSILQSPAADAWHLSWVGDINTRVNTVSSIEREIKVVPGLVAGAKFGILSVDGMLGFGYMFLEIDDDVPRSRGYQREDLRNQAWVFSPALDATLELSPHFKLMGRAQEWHDGSVWLETKYSAALDWDVSRTIPHSNLKFSVEVTRYNFSVYAPLNPTGPFQPVVPWDDDRLMMLSLNTWW